MNTRNTPGLGELLRYVSELVEHGAEEHYRQMQLNYRARYTPVLRALHSGAQTISEVTACTHLTQGAISQTVGHMQADGVVTRQRGEDGRQSLIRLTPHGEGLLCKLQAHWQATFAAIEQLEQEIGHPLRQVLEHAASALEQQGFSQRLSAVKLACAAEEVVSE
ncbi:MarR family winged helix-turn-helix transcriptional regulator [Pseudomonas fakonensis]|uniref:MarR family winged helix-turn-helix transcriptional regulator n=1 Tax=Pseudomonas fakonensis TaxID=2842355 RepID=A0ABX8MZB7_9PSED|nr:MarR family winged helix-turn-helix transcriptional regulator [Pseudomonas fakonensis]QXH49475.1 MarR family winged helix-turn-helix transcriptional regulator [Pseudomonas fakonensis]